MSASMPRMALIEWIDSASQGSHNRVWFSQDEILTSIEPIISIGFVYHETPEVITLISGYGMINGLRDWDHMGHVTEPFRIPIGCIKSIIYLEAIKER